MELRGLKEIRRKKGYSQVKVSMELNMSREALSHYENGRRKSGYTYTVCTNSLYDKWSCCPRGKI